MTPCQPAASPAIPGVTPAHLACAGVEAGLPLPLAGGYDQPLALAVAQ